MSKKSCGGSILAFGILNGIGIAIIYMLPKSSFAVQADFAKGLIYNDMDKVRAITSAEKWQLLENWEIIHAPIPENCMFPSDPDVGTTSVGRFDEETGQDIASFIIGRECPDDFYHITVDNIAVTKVDGHWVVVSWGEYCERSYKRESSCFEFNQLEK